MTLKFEIGDWVKLRNEKDYYNVKSVNPDSGYVSLEDIAGHIWEVSRSSIEKKCTNKEIYGVTEKTTADEFNKKAGGSKLIKMPITDYGPPYGPHNPTGNEYSKFGDGEEEE
jgi:hypothetical protein